MDINSLAEQGNTQEVKKLLDSGVSIETERPDGRTPLIVACLRGREETVKMLIERGADIKHKNKRGSDSLIHAVFSGNLNIVKMLIEKGSDVNSVDNENRNSLHFACQKGFLEIVKYLVEVCQINIKSVTKDGKTALHFACLSNNKDLVKYLIEKGCDVNQSSVDKRTCIYNAVLSKNLELCEYLREMGANLTVVDQNSVSLIHLAIESNQYTLVQWAFSHIPLDQLPFKDFSIFNILASKTYNHDIMTIVDYCIDAPPPPSSLTLLKATQTTLHLRIGTSLPSYVPPYQQYEVQQQTGFFGNWETSTCEIHENEVYIVKLSAKTKYNIRIRGQNRNDWSAYSHAFEFKTTNEKDPLESPFKQSIAMTAVPPSSPLPRSPRTQTTTEKPATTLFPSSMIDRITLKTPTTTEPTQEIKSLESLTAAEEEEKKRKQQEEEQKHREESLFQAVINHQIDELKRVAAEGYSLDIVNPAGLSLLHSACKYNDLEIVKYLVEVAHIDVNRTNESGSLPIHFAIFANNYEIFEYLHSKGGDLHGVDSNGLNCLLIAANRANEQIFDYIYDLSTDAERQSIDNNGRNALILSISSKNLSFIKHLVSLHYDLHLRYINNKVQTGWNLLYFAIYTKEESIIQYLLDHGVSPLERSNDETTPLSFATSQGMPPSIIALLTKYSSLPLQPTLLSIENENKNSKTLAVKITFQAPPREEPYALYVNDMIDLKYRKTGLFSSWQSIQESLTSSAITVSETANKPVSIYTYHCTTTFQYNTKYRVKLSIHNKNGWSDASAEKEFYFEVEEEKKTPPTTPKMSTPEPTTVIIEPVEQPKPRPLSPVQFNQIDFEKLKTVYKVVPPQQPEAVLSEKERDESYQHYSQCILDYQQALQAIELMKKEEEKETTTPSSTTIKETEPTSEDLFEAIYAKNVPQIRYYIEHYPQSLICYNEEGFTLLHACIQSHLSEILLLLLQVPAINVNIETKTTQLTPLHIACLYGYEDMIEILLKNHADLYALDSKKVIPIFYLPFAPTNTLRALQCFLEHGYNVNYLNMNMATILHVYCSLSYIQTSIFTLLYQYNIDVNAIDKLGRNGLHYAAISNNIYAFEWLVQHGCRLEAVDTQHYRPEDLARYYHHQTLLTILQHFSSVPVVTCPPVVHVLQNSILHIQFNLQQEQSFGIPPITEIAVEIAKYPSFSTWDALLTTTKCSIYVPIQKGCYLCRYRCKNANGWSDYSPISSLFNTNEVTNIYDVKNFTISSFYLYLQEHNLEAIYTYLLAYGVQDVNTFLSLSVEQIQSLNLPPLLYQQTIDLLPKKQQASKQESKDKSNWFKF